MQLMQRPLCIIVPAYGEEENIDQLIKRLSALDLQRHLTVFVVDDSPNELTVGAVHAANNAYQHAQFTVKCLHREGDMLHGGLSGAVTDGFWQAGPSSLVIVMDADLQHPPELVPALLALADQGYGLVMASRYCLGGSSDGLSGGVRHLVSHASTWLAKVLFPRRLRGVTDPMTGFFAVDLARVNLPLIKARGFKILLELLTGQPQTLRASEVPLNFGERHAGTSKGDMRQGLAFLQQIVRLRLSRRVQPPAMPSYPGRHRRLSNP